MSSFIESLPKSVYDQIMNTIGEISKSVINPDTSTYFEFSIDITSPPMSGDLQIETVLRGKVVLDVVNKITAEVHKIFHPDHIFIGSFTYDMADENEVYGIPDSLTLRIAFK